MSEWHNVSNLKPLWSEDDASRAVRDDSREQVDGAWKRLFSQEFHGIQSALDRHDGGDCIFYLFPEGRVLMSSFDGDHVYLVSEVSAPFSQLDDDGVEPSDLDEEEMSEDQVKALDLLLEAIDNGERILLLEGAAGTGKTWLMRKFTERVKALGWSIRYMAPTGKAAHRLSQSVGEEVSTIHSALYKRVMSNKKGEPIFADPQPLAEVRTVIVCDEGSMVGSRLHRDIVANLPSNCILLYVGDPEQLEPVRDTWGPSFGRPTAALTLVHRQALDSPVLRVATELRGGGKLPTNNVGDAYFYEQGRLADAARWLIGHIEAGNDAVCLTYTNKAREGINRLVRLQLGYRSAGAVVVGDRLVVRRNNRAAGKMNGETFNVRELTDVGGALRMVTTTGDVLFTHPCLVGADSNAFEKIRDKYAILTNTRLWVQIDYGYCLTVHTSQGSEFQHVLLAMTGTLRWMVTTGKMKPDSARRLCYTALTRAKSTFTRLDTGK